MPVNVMAIHCNDRQVHDHLHCTSDIFIFRLLREFVQITKFCMSWRHFRNLFYEYCQREYPPPFQFRKLTDHSPLLLTLHRGRGTYIFIYKYYIYTHIIYVYNVYIYIYKLVPRPLCRDINRGKGSVSLYARNFAF